IAISPQGAVGVGGTKTITLAVGTDGIQGGTKLTMSRIRYDLDCNRSSPVTLPCTDQGDIFNYQGDATITTTCGVCAAGNVNAGASCAPAGPGGGCDAPGGGPNDGTCVALNWTSNVSGGGAVTNEIVFTPPSPIALPTGINPFCSISFDV